MQPQSRDTVRGHANGAPATQTLLGGLRTAVTSAPRKRAFDGPPLDNADLYLNRELTWLAFNRRVLAEAEDDRNPLLERVKFLAITGSNLDEFFMKRIGGLKQQVAAHVPEITVDGRTSQEQIEACQAWIRGFVVERAAVER